MLRQQPRGDGARYRLRWMNAVVEHVKVPSNPIVKFVDGRADLVRGKLLLLPFVEGGRQAIQFARELALIGDAGEAPQQLSFTPADGIHDHWSASSVWRRAEQNAPGKVAPDGEIP
ncbi:MAG TPA: hypothetical protein VES88_07380 [Gemmatimonadaceae bacterium]|nr:hypothetical protein [Gemmatimonadaceae bacterium]